MSKECNTIMKVTTAGLNDEEEMHFDIGIWGCKDIDDGIAMDIGGGWWVIAFEDFRRLYFAARDARAAARGKG